MNFTDMINFVIDGAVKGLEIVCILFLFVMIIVVFYEVLGPTKRP